MKKKNGFTLAETLIVLVILGVIAALTIPSLVKRQTEQQNRTKIKKAMTMYDTTIQKMVIENGFKDANSLNTWAKTNTCSNARGYFKIVDDGDNACQFKTSDGLWWDIGKNAENIMKPIVALKKENLTTDVAGGDTNDAFYFVTSYDENAMAFRSNDAQYELAQETNKEDITKLFAFVKPEISSSDDDAGDEEDEESGGNAIVPINYTTECTGCDEYGENCDNPSSCRAYNEWGSICMYDENGTLVASYFGCEDAENLTGCRLYNDRTTGNSYENCSDAVQGIGCQNYTDGATGNHYEDCTDAIKGIGCTGYNDSAANNWYYDCSDAVNHIGCSVCIEDGEEITCP